MEDLPKENSVIVPGVGMLLECVNSDDTQRGSCASYLLNSVFYEMQNQSFRESFLQ